MTDQTSIFEQDKLLDMYEALPKPLKEAIFAVDAADKVMRAGQKFGLNIEQIGKLAETTGLVMLGALHPRSYVQKLESELGIARVKAIEVAKEINHDIFFPVREALKKLHNMEDTEEVTGERVMEKGDFLKKLVELRGNKPGSEIMKQAVTSPNLPIAAASATPTPLVTPPPPPPSIKEAPKLQQPIERQISPSNALPVRELPSWAVGAKAEIRQTEEDRPISGLKLPEKPVQKIPMQEIRPRPETEPTSKPTSPRSMDDKYREPIE